MDSSASIQISYDADTGRVKITVDESSNGSFVSCVEEIVNLPENWWKNVYIGVSASTGDLADNHDLIEIVTYTGISSLPEGLMKVDDKVEKEKKEELEKLLQNEGISASRLNPKEYAFYMLLKETYDNRQRELGKIKRELEHSMAGRSF